MKKKEIISELERIAKHNHNVESMLTLYKEGYKPLDIVMLEMIALMAFDSYTLREIINRLKQNKNVDSYFNEEKSQKELENS